MSAPHIVLELRTSRDNEAPIETAAQFFSALPKLKNRLVAQLLRQTEHLSFELLVWNQTIYFLCYVPIRLQSYFESLLQSSYPEIVITPLTYDPLLIFSNKPQQAHVQFMEQQSSHKRYGELKMSDKSWLPLKDYRDFTNVDPLATILATLSKSEIYDRVAIQLVVKPRQRALRQGERVLLNHPEHAHKDLIAKKLKSTNLSALIRIAVSANSDSRAELLLETVAAGFSSMTSSEGNSLRLRRALIPQRFEAALLGRSSRLIFPELYSLEELATIYHLPNQALSHIPNIAWGKNLLGEPPENLPVIYQGMHPELKNEINPYARTTFKNQPAIYGLRRADRRRHFYVIGKTGTGKSTMLANMAINDLKRGEGLCVIDPHGDLVDILLDYIPSHRINDVVYFNPTDTDKTVKINLFEGENVEHRELIASGIISVFKKLYAYSWGPRLEYILRNSLLTLLKIEGSRMSDIIELLTNEKFREKKISALDDPILKNFWLDEFNKLTERQRNEQISSILNKVGQFVSSPLVRNVVNAHKSSFRQNLTGQLVSRKTWGRQRHFTWRHAHHQNSTGRHGASKPN